MYKYLANAALAAGILVSACGSSASGESDGGPWIDSAEASADIDVCSTFNATAFLEDTCGGVVCHASNTRSGLDLESAGVLERIADAPSMSCDGETILVEGDLEASFFVAKLRGEVPADCGDPMPPLGDPLTAREITCLEQWLLSPSGD
ncbi:MAG: hypothetical protein AAF411_07195 [Myxococcota bacterium]